MSYGTTIPGLHIHGKPALYPVVNERAVRATAGTMMLIGFITFTIVYNTKDYGYLYPTVIAFWLQFFISTVRGPQRAPFSILGRRMVSFQKPEYIGAMQKRFARMLGLLMSTILLGSTRRVENTGYIPLIVGIALLLFMRMESTLGICAGCKIYYRLVRAGRMKDPENIPACAGGVCSTNPSDK